MSDACPDCGREYIDRIDKSGVDRVDHDAVYVHDYDNLDSPMPAITDHCRVSGS